MSHSGAQCAEEPSWARDPVRLSTGGTGPLKSRIPGGRTDSGSSISAASGPVPLSPRRHLAHDPEPDLAGPEPRGNQVSTFTNICTHLPEPADPRGARFFMCVCVCACRTVERVSR